LLPGAGITADSLVIRTPYENYLQEILDMVKIIANTGVGQEKNGNETPLFKCFADPI
jgi:aspartate carbamoyltransferase catalytic subunit